MTEGTLEVISKYSNSLESLNVVKLEVGSSEPVIQVIKHCTQLRTFLACKLSVIDNELACLMSEYLLHVTQLNLSRTSVEDEGVIAISTKLQNIQNFQLDALRITDRAVTAVINQLSNLHTLSLCDCPLLSIQTYVVILAALRNACVLSSLDLNASCTAIAAERMMDAPLTEFLSCEQLTYFRTHTGVFFYPRSSADKAYQRAARKLK